MGNWKLNTPQDQSINYETPNHHPHLNTYIIMNGDENHYNLFGNLEQNNSKKEKIVFRQDEEEKKGQGFESIFFTKLFSEPKLIIPIIIQLALLIYFNYSTRVKNTFTQ